MPQLDIYLIYIEIFWFILFFLIGYLILYYSSLNLAYNIKFNKIFIKKILLFFNKYIFQIKFINKNYTFLVIDYIFSTKYYKELNNKYFIKINFFIFYLQNLSLIKFYNKKYDNNFLIIKTKLE